MRITYDPSVWAMYSYIQEGKKVKKAIPLGSAAVNVDLAEDGSIIGFEFLFHQKLDNYQKRELGVKPVA